MAGAWVVEVLVRWSSEVLLPMSVVAQAPVVYLGVVYGTERCFVAVKHEFVVCEHPLQVLQVVSEAFLAHKGANERAPLSAKRQRVTLLLQFV